MAKGVPEKLLREVAESLDSPRGSLAYLPELFADLGALGTTPRRVVNWLGDAGIGGHDAVVDLGCGKGAAAVWAARRLGCTVLGVDAFEPFVEAARMEAARWDVRDRCMFEVGDFRAEVRRRRRFDAGMMLSVAPADVAAGALHRLVRPGGVYIVDDAVWVGREATERMPRAGEARAVFEQLGDAVIREHLFTPAEVRRIEARSQRTIAARARALSKREPGARQVVRELLSRQRAAVRALTSGPLRPALWMVRRGKGE